MMPFFALMMLESRLRRFKKERIAEFEKETGATFDADDATHAQWMDDSAKAINKGYHKDLLLYGKGLRETCLVPGGNFLNRLLSHLNQYDPDTKKLLGIDYAQGSAKFLDMQGKASGILDFTKPELAKHSDEKRAAFAEQVVKHLASKMRDDDDRVGAKGAVVRWRR